MLLPQGGQGLGGVILPTITALGERGVPGSFADNAIGYFKEAYNTGVGYAALQAGWPYGVMIDRFVPRAEIADNQLLGAAIYEGGSFAGSAIFGGSGAVRGLTAKGVAGSGRAVTDFVADATVVSHGRVIGRGIVDVRATVEGIQSGRLAARDVFRNAEGLLPPKPAGYYREFVHPTPGVSGAGPQRIVAGRGGELYYTPDHYRTFIPLN